MADQQPPERASSEPSQARELARLRARLAAVFGDALPDGAGSERANSRSEADYRADRPPHHGG